MTIKAPDWKKSLWDTDGYQHYIVAQGGGQVVTTVQNLGFAVWDRVTGELLFPAHAENRLGGCGAAYMLRNNPLSEEEAQRKAVAASICMSLLHAETPTFCIARTAQQGCGSHFVKGPFPSLTQAAAIQGTGELIFRVAPGKPPSMNFCNVCGCDTSGWQQSHVADCPNIPY